MSPAPLIFREATPDDVFGELAIRPNETGWVCELEGRIIAIAIADIRNSRLQAIHVAPAYERRGIGKTLHHLIMNRYFREQGQPVTAEASAGSRAETFLRKLGWEPAHTSHKDPIRFSMSRDRWTKVSGMTTLP